MSETVEFIGAEHVLAKRGETPEIHDQIIRICEDYEKHLALAGQDCRTGQPTPCNKVGGLSTIEEKKSRLYSQGWNTSGIRGPSGSG